MYNDVISSLQFTVLLKRKLIFNKKSYNLLSCKTYTPKTYYRGDEKRFLLMFFALCNDSYVTNKHIFLGEQRRCPRYVKVYTETF